MRSYNRRRLKGFLTIPIWGWKCYNNAIKWNRCLGKCATYESDKLQPQSRKKFLPRGRERTQPDTRGCVVQIQDYYIALKLGWADRSLSEMSAVDEFHKSLFIFALFGQLAHLSLGWLVCLYFLFQFKGGKKKVLVRQAGLPECVCRKFQKVELNDSWSGTRLVRSLFRACV